MSGHLPNEEVGRVYSPVFVGVTESLFAKGRQNIEKKKEDKRLLGQPEKETSSLLEHSLKNRGY